MSESAPAKTANLRELPSVDQLLKTEAALKLKTLIGAPRLTAIARIVTDDLRAELQAASVSGNTQDKTRDGLLSEAVQRLEAVVARDEGELGAAGGHVVALLLAEGV